MTPRRCCIILKIQSVVATALLIVDDGFMRLKKTAKVL